jgi:hypothetical protein
MLLTPLDSQVADNKKIKQKKYNREKKGSGSSRHAVQ